MSGVTEKMSRAIQPGLNGHRRLLSVSLVLVTALASGCASYQKDHFTVGSVPSDYRTNHPIVVSQSEVKTDLVVSRSMKGMSFRHENIVVDFIGRYKRSGASSIRILLPAGSHNEAAARRVGTDIVREMKDQGLNANQIKISRYHASNHGDSATVRLSYDAVAANVATRCGQWRDDIIDTSQNMNYGNYGCATQNNLAKMVANPEDLLGPRGESEIDATRRDNVINDWRDGGSDPLPSLL